MYLCFVSSSYDVGYPVLEQPTRVNETKPHIGYSRNRAGRWELGGPIYTIYYVRETVRTPDRASEESPVPWCGASLLAGVLRKK